MKSSYLSKRKKLNNNVVDELISAGGHKTVRLYPNKQGGGLANFISEDLKFEIQHGVPLHNLESTTRCRYRQL